MGYETGALSEELAAFTGQSVEASVMAALRPRLDVEPRRRAEADPAIP